MGGKVMAATGDATGLNTSAAVDGGQVSVRFAWLAVFFAAWLVASLELLGWAIGNDLAQDVELSPYHIPFYAAIVTLIALCSVLAVRAVRSGRGWRHALPENYGILAIGALCLLAWPIADIGWREGVGIIEARPEQVLAPSRLLIFIGLLLIAGAPLRAALAWADPRLRWPAAASAAMCFAIIGILGFMPGQNNWMEVAESGAEDDSEIWVMNADGSMQTRLIEAADGFEYGNPVWSPDGTHIAFTKSAIAANVNTRATDTAIWIADTGGTNQRLLIDGPAWYWLPRWSPDGQWIVFTIDLEHGVGAQAGVMPPEFGYGQPVGGGQLQAVIPNIDVWRMKADGTTEPERLTTDPAEDRSGAYSPDGKHLLFDSTRQEGKTALYVTDADGSNATRITFFGDEWGGTWSPDGTAIAFHAHPDNNSDIYVTSFPPLGPPRRLTNDEAVDWTPAWSPDGSRIAFLTDRSNDQDDIWSVAVDGSDQVNLSRTPGAGEWISPGGGAWGADGRIVYVRTQNGNAGQIGWVRDGLGTFELLFGALVLGFLVALVVVIGAPFGAVALILGVGAAASALAGGDWRFVPAAVIGGLLVDVLVRLTPVRRKPIVAAGGAAAVFVLGAGITVKVSTDLGWSSTLLLGVTLAAALFAAALAAVVGHLRMSAPTTVDG
jgi:TolB protein